MRKIILFLLLFFIVVSADEKVEIFATRINSKDDIIHSSGGVAVAYKDYYLTASRAIYNKATGELELFHDVRANQNDEYKILGNYAKLNIKNKKKKFSTILYVRKRISGLAEC